jgi:hypothetical protein
MEFIIITHIPTRQGFLGPIQGKNLIEETEAPDLDSLKEGLHVPLDGYCLVVEKENATKIEAHIVNEIS